MSEEEKESNVSSSINAATGLVQAIPIYQDLIQPAAKEAGAALALVVKTINVALAPVKTLVWGYEQIERFVSTVVANKLRNVPIERISTPNPRVAVPLLESLRYCGHEEVLRDMYASLLAASIDKETMGDAHPAFVEVVRQLTPAEARLLKALCCRDGFPLICEYRFTDSSRYGTNHPSRDPHAVIRDDFSKLAMELSGLDSDYSGMALDNLLRLKLVEVVSDSTQRFDEYRLRRHLRRDDGGMDFSREIQFEYHHLDQIRFSDFGRFFTKACLAE